MFGFYMQEKITKKNFCKCCKKQFNVKGIIVGKDNSTIIRWHEKDYCEECGNERKRRLKYAQNNT